MYRYPATDLSSCSTSSPDYCSVYSKLSIFLLLIWWETNKEITAQILDCFRTTNAAHNMLIRLYWNIKQSELKIGSVIYSLYSKASGEDMRTVLSPVMAVFDLDHRFHFRLNQDESNQCEFFFVLMEQRSGTAGSIRESQINPELGLLSCVKFGIFYCVFVGFLSPFKYMPVDWLASQPWPGQSSYLRCINEFTNYLMHVRILSKQEVICSQAICISVSKDNSLLQ